MLLDRLEIRPNTRVLDLGCGWGELLLRAVAAGGSDDDVSTCGVGVDTDSKALERARALADNRALADRVSFVDGAAAAWSDQADRIICIGAAHAWGGAANALEALRPLLRPGGRLLYGDACWEQPPTGPASALFGDDVLSLADLVGHATRLGWRVLHLTTADQREWDEFEATWRAGRQEWLLANPTDERAPAVRERLDAQLDEYVSLYRGVLGFCYLVLARSTIPPPPG